MNDIVFLNKEDVLLIHDDQLDRYGGRAGVISEGGIESALAAPQNWLAYAQYNEGDELLGAAATYLHEFATTQYFVDGNKRTAAASADAFLQVNGYELTCDDSEVYRMTKLAAKKHLNREGLIEWLRDCVSARP